MQLVLALRHLVSEHASTGTRKAGAARSPAPSSKTVRAISDFYDAERRTSRTRLLALNPAKGSYARKRKIGCQEEAKERGVLTFARRSTAQYLQVPKGQRDIFVGKSAQPSNTGSLIAAIIVFGYHCRSFSISSGPVGCPPTGALLVDSLEKNSASRAVRQR